MTDIEIDSILSAISPNAIVDELELRGIPHELAVDIILVAWANCHPPVSAKELEA